MNKTDFYKQEYCGNTAYNRPSIDELLKRTAETAVEETINNFEEKDPQFGESVAHNITQTNVTEWDNALQPGEVANGFTASYDSDSKKILVTVDGKTEEIDATLFIKDGMIDNVEVANNNIEITFNTDAGKETITIPVKDIFDASLYYTKEDIDGFAFLTEETDPTVPSWVKEITTQQINRWDGAALDYTQVLTDYSNIASRVLNLERAVYGWYGTTNPNSSTNGLTGDVVTLTNEINRLNVINKYILDTSASSGDEINGMTNEEAANANVIVATDDAVAALATPKTFKTIGVVDATIGGNSLVYLNGTESVNVSGVVVDGQKASNSNGKINYNTSDMTISNVTVEDGCTAYNIFEGGQGSGAANTDSFVADSIVADDTSLKHNIFNIYQFNDNANVTISNSSFNLNVSNSNVMRLANYSNAENVTINFENVDWTYENVEASAADWEWAGLVIYQPSSTDVALNGDTTKIATWTFNFKNCRYNGEKVTANNFGEHNQVLYFYNVNKSGGVSDPETYGVTINFE